MFRKIFIGALLVGLFAVLVFGAVNRTIAKAGNENQRSQSETFVGNGQGLDHQGRTDSLDTESPNSGGRGNGNGGNSSGQENRGSEENRGGEEPRGGQVDRDFQGRGNGQGQGGGNESGNGPTEVNERISLQAQVVSMDDELLTLALQDGNMVEVEGRTLRFLIERGFTVQSGDQVDLVGFHDQDGTLEISEIKNLTTGASLVIRNENGRPMWAGQNNN